MNAAVQTSTTDPAAPAPEELTPEQEDAAYEAAFNAQVAKMESEKPDDPAPPAEDPDPAPAPEPVPAAPVVVPDDDLLGLVPADKRDALAQRLKAAAELEARAKKLEQDNRSMAGRMSAYQRKYEEAAGKRPPAAPEVTAPAPTEDPPEWTQFAQDYPDIAKAIEARTAKAGAGTDPKLADAVKFYEQEQRNRFLQDAWEAVESVHQGWRDVARSKEFQEWKATSQTYERLAASDDVSDAIALFDLYGAFRTKTSAPPPNPATVAAAAKLAARREAQVDGARTPTNRATAPNQSVDLNDEDQLFAYYAAKSNARLKARSA
jgi:hypothetical protein